MTRTGNVIIAFRGAYRYLSNFYVEDDGLSLEHRFQAAKPTTAEEVRWVLSAPNPKVAKARGRGVRLRPDWEEIKDTVMLNLVRAKFTPDSELAGWLMGTHPTELQEGNEWGDEYWGVNLRTGKGENRLGKILMQVRAELLSRRTYLADVPTELRP